MAQYLLGIDLLAKLACGVALLAVPRALARLAGLPAANEAFWPRLLGALLLGLAAAGFVELQLAPGKALGLIGSVAVNVTVAALLGALLILGKAGSTKRGRTILWLAAATLALHGLVAIVSGT